MVIKNKTFGEYLAKDSRGRRIKSETYNLGLYKNLETVLGENFFLWFLPTSKKNIFLRK
jgi:hypothetical protein